ncbi:MAG: type VI secretion system ImpA family N-terminal domain-containing protein, partial [Planctomycetaceae bacterium]
MGSPEFLDFDTLLAPISDDNPTGDSFRAIDGMAYQDLRKLRDESRKNENRMVFTDDGTDQSHQPEWTAEPEWNLVFDRCVAGLRDTSKDLQLTAWLIEAAIRLEGFRGLRDGLRLVRLLCERYWDDLNPLPDEDGMETRVAPLAGLNGEDADGPLVTAIRNVQITNSETFDPGTVWQI